MADHSMPTPVTVASGLLVAWGTYALVTMLLGWATGMGGLFNIDFGFVGIPIGAGILSASQASRKWAVFFAGLCLVTGAWMAFEWVRSSMAVPSRSDIAAWGVLMLGAAFVVWALCARRHREWFAHRIESSAGIPVRGFVWAMFTVATVLVTLHFVTAMRLENAFAVHCRLIPVDSKTSQPLQNMKLSCEELSTTNDGRLSMTWESGPKGISAILEGVAFTPLNVVVKSDGYEPGTMTLIPGLSGDQHVLLKPSRQDQSR